MNIKPIAVFILCTFLVCSCDRPEKKHQANAKTIDASSQAQLKKTFFDTVISKMDIPLSQLKHHLLNPNYFSHYTHFSGDTVYYPNSSYPIIILSMDFQGVCLEKYLLVYKKGGQKNTDCFRVETDCDIDYGTNYSKLNYKIFNKTQFYTRDALYEVDAASKVKIRKTDQFYQINDSGKIDSLKQKPISIVLPKFIPVDVIDHDQ